MVKEYFYDRVKEAFRNPMMGFLVGTPFLVLAASTCLSSIATGIFLYADWRRIMKYRQKHAIK